MSPAFAEIAPHYDALRPLTAGDRERLRRTIAEAGLGPHGLVVEVGAGTGLLTMPLAGITPGRVVGVDSEPRMLEVARSKDREGRVDWRQGSAYRLPLHDDAADLVLMVRVVHLLRQRGRAFREARRILKPGGRLSIWTFTPRHVSEFYLNRYFPSIPLIDGPRFPPIETLTAELRRAGFGEVGAEVTAEPRTLSIAQVVDRVRGRYISTLRLLPPLEYRLGLQQLEETLAQDPSVALTQRTEWAVLTARK